MAENIYFPYKSTVWARFLWSSLCYMVSAGVAWKPEVTWLGTRTIWRLILTGNWYWLLAGTPTHGFSGRLLGLLPTLDSKNEHPKRRRRKCLAFLWLAVISWCLTTWLIFCFLHVLFVCFFSKNFYILWLLPYLFGTVPQSYLKGCLLGCSPQ